MAAIHESVSAMMPTLRPAAIAFDAIAPVFDSRFGVWCSVAAQRRAVRAALLQAFPTRGHILELGGGTGEDAAFLAERGFDMLLTDPSPVMVARARTKLAPLGSAGRNRGWRRDGGFRHWASFNGRSHVRWRVLQFRATQLRG